MRNITNELSDNYQPYKALLIYQKNAADANERESSIYVESYDIGKTGNPINAHPLTIRETLTLSSLFQSAADLKTGYLRTNGIIPDKVLYVNPETSGYAVWYTAPQEVPLFFAEALGITSGRGKVPAMVWKADRNGLSVFALKGGRKPNEKTALYHAPYFNIYQDGKVCMGTVRVNITPGLRLEEFMGLWENYFWNSYFSHLMFDFNPVTENIVQLWQKQVATDRPFPFSALKPQRQTLQSLLV